MAHNVFGEVDKICFRSYSKKYGEALQKLLFSKGYDWDINVNKEKFKCYENFNSDYLTIQSNVLFQTNFVRNNQEWSIEKLMGELPNHPDLKAVKKPKLGCYWVHCPNQKVADILAAEVVKKGWKSSTYVWTTRATAFSLHEDASCGFLSQENRHQRHKLSIEEFLKLET